MLYSNKTTNCFTSDEKFFVLSPFQDWLYFIGLCICGFGFILSLLTFAIYVRKTNKQSKDIYSCALAICDCLSNLTGVLYTLSSLSKWGYSSYMCRSTIYLWRAIPTLSWALILSIAVTRYFAVIKYDLFKRRFNMKVVLFNMIGVIVFAFVAAVPFPFLCTKVECTKEAELKKATRPQAGDYVYQLNREWTMENQNEALFEYVSLYRVAIVSVITIALIYLYSIIIMDLRKRSADRKRLTAQIRRLSSSESELSDSMNRQRSETVMENLSNQLDALTSFFTGATEKVKTHIQATFGFSDDSDMRTEVMFINVAVFFAVTNLPYSIVEMIDNLRENFNPNPKTTSMFLLFFLLGFNTNPFIFYFSNPWFKNELNTICSRICGCCRKKKKERNNVANGNAGHEVASKDNSTLSIETAIADEEIAARNDE